MHYGGICLNCVFVKLLYSSTFSSSYYLYPSELSMEKANFILLNFPFFVLKFVNFSKFQSFQGHGLLRVPPASSPSSSLPNTSQGMQPSNQPWLPSSSQGKPPLPTPSYRPQANSPAMQQRSHIPQQQNHPLTPASQQQQITSAPQQQPAQSHQPQEHFAQQFQPSRSSQGLPHQQQAARAQGPANQKVSPLAPSQTSNTQTMTQSRAITAESEEPCSRILSKRSIGKLVNQVSY